MASAKTIGLNDAEVGLVMGAQLATTMLAKPLSGRLSDRVGRKPMILAGLFLCAVTLPAIPGLVSFWLLLPVCGLFGLGVAIVTPSTTALVADLTEAGRMGSAIGVFGTIWDSGTHLVRQAPRLPRRPVARRRAGGGRAGRRAARSARDMAPSRSAGQARGVAPSGGATAPR